MSGAMTRPAPNLYKTLFSTCVGNALEWFDIAVYAFFARYIAHEFFPTEDPSVSLLLTFGSFGVSFLIRPLGAIVLVCWLALLKSCYFATVPSMMADLFPVSTRASGMSISYNIAVTVFGGFAPLICSLLITATGTSLAPGYYLMALAVLSCAALAGSKRYQAT